MIALTGRTLEYDRLFEFRPRFLRIIAAEISGFAQLGDSIIDGFPGFTANQIEEAGPVFLEQISEALEDFRSPGSANCVPSRLSRRRRCYRAVDVFAIRFADLADQMSINR